MFPFFRKKENDFTPGAALKVDMHSHLIPGIDDGAPDTATSIRLIRGLAGMGYRKVITTPHIMQGVYPNTSGIIREGLDHLKAELQNHTDLSIEIEAAAEYFMDLHFENLVEADDLLYFGKEKYVLVEMSFMAPSPNYENILFSLFNKGYTPILAHPERYTYWHHHPEIFERIAQMGCKLQVNLLSLTGYYGKDVMKAGEGLVQSGLADFLGTDAHHQRHVNALINYRLVNRKLTTVLGSTTFLNEQLL